MAYHFLLNRSGSPGPRDMREAASHEEPPPPRSLAEYLSRHHDELMTLVEARRRPEYADRWEEI
ncbi:hypothetical protein JL101_011315 [Skermanella rosea]|uniref:hypothetical protein n=1 Tax=Skermanella rosea TaxID=1817965 RepID=UPI0019311883|nr:hypothetical protein [Skermanella rosea]UEM05987.1 hypothetical protein JL101_011315 [Skermanella rosea]